MPKALHPPIFLFIFLLLFLAFPVQGFASDLSASPARTGAGNPGIADLASRIPRRASRLRSDFISVMPQTYTRRLDKGCPTQKKVSPT